MHLNEIAFKKNQNEDGVTDYDPDLKQHMTWDVGIEFKELRPTIEQVKTAEKHGMLDTQIPMIAAYRIPQSPKIGGSSHLNKMDKPIVTSPQDIEDIARLKDAMKSRNPSHRMSEENIVRMCSAAVDKILGIDSRSYAVKRMHSPKLKALGFMQSILTKHASNTVLVPLGSSAPLAKTFAGVLSKKTGIPVVHALDKVKARLSSHFYTKEQGYQPRGTDDQVTATQMKNVGRGKVDHKRGYYGGQEISDPNVLDLGLSEKNIVFVDDNFETGVSIVHAAMAFLELDIIPASFTSINIHQMY